MAHYFTNDEIEDTHTIDVQFEMDGRSFSLVSQPGVFSKDKLDTGTRILLESVLQETPAHHVLDLGCGIGVIGVVLSSFWKCEVTGIDISSRAAELAKTNYRKYKVHGQVINQDGVSGTYDCVLLNPPIRAGKEVIYRLFRESFAALSPDGNLYIVIRKQHGAASAVKYLESLGFEVSRLNRDKGFWVVKAHKPSSNSSSAMNEDPNPEL